MIDKSLPWDEIRIPAADYNVRLISDTDAVPLYWGRDTEGHCLFIIELQGEHTEQFHEDRVAVRGIDVDLRRSDTDVGQRLILKLEKQVDKDLFLGLCETMITNLRPVTEAGTALAVALTHLKRWKMFMSGKKRHLLSEEEIRGLFAELQFLRFLYRERLSEKAAVDSWTGPEGGHQDFIFGNTAIEVKSVSGRERSSVRISSEEQLESLCDNLFLVIFRINTMPESGQGMSLNALVALIEEELSDADAAEEFLRKLAAYGYADIVEYNKPAFVVIDRQVYSIEWDFPRLIRSRIPDGVVRVMYEIELEKITAYLCDIAKVTVN